MFRPAFSAPAIVYEVEKRGANIVISQRKNRIEKRPIDNDIYKRRHLVVNFFRNQIVQAYRHAKRQNGPKLQSHGLFSSISHQFKMALNRLLHTCANYIIGGWLSKGRQF
jgi:hypothetical protein